jgi:DNA-binding MurR/RpiR family transcriptional regulator
MNRRRAQPRQYRIDSPRTRGQLDMRVARRATEAESRPAERTQNEAPSDLDQLVSKIRDDLASLPEKQRRVAGAVIDAPEAIAFGPVREVAARLEVNAATIIRFAQSLGYDGYQSLQAVVRRGYLTRAALQIPRDPQALDQIGAVAATQAQQRANWEVAWASLQMSELEAICRAILAARRIIVVASGSGFLVGSLLERLLRQLGMQLELVHATGAGMAMALFDANAEDVVIGIGTRLAFTDTTKALRVARGRGARTVAIAGSSTNALAGAADHAIIAPTQGQPLRFSLVALIAMAEAIAARIAEADPERARLFDSALQDLLVEEGVIAPIPSTPRRITPVRRPKRARR